MIESYENIFLVNKNLLKTKFFKLHVVILISLKLYIVYSILKVVRLGWPPDKLRNYFKLL